MNTLGIIGQGFVGNAVRLGMQHVFDIKAYDKDGKFKLCNKDTKNLGENLKGCSFLSKNTNYKCDNAVYYGGYGFGIGNGSHPVNRSSGIQWV